MLAKEAQARSRYHKNHILCTQRIQFSVLPLTALTYLENFEMWSWGKMENISWTNHVKMKYYVELRRKGIS